MNSFREAKEQAEQKRLLELMSRIESNPAISQRALASELGIALGLMNAYLKRCVKKGWIKVGHASASRLAYSLTPQGFVEKSKTVGKYLSKSFTLFRDAKTQCESIFDLCERIGWRKIALVGEGDLTDIALLLGRASGLVIDKTGIEADLTSYDAVLITDIEDPQSVYNDLRNHSRREPTSSFGFTSNFETGCQLRF